MLMNIYIYEYIYIHIILNNKCYIVHHIELIHFDYCWISLFLKAPTWDHHKRSFCGILDSKTKGVHTIL